MAWFDTNWLNRKRITIQSSQVQADETGFPVLIKRIDTDFSSARADGFDFVFTKADGVTEIPYERQRWIDGTGELVAWVKSDILDSADVDIYIYYNNSGQATDKADPENVWDDNYKGVWHLESTSDLLDSTQYNNDATNNGASNAIEEKIGGALDFDGVLDGVDIPFDSTIDLSRLSDWQIEAWVNPDSLDDDPDYAWPTVAGQGFHRVSLGLTNPNDGGTAGIAGRGESWIDDEQGVRTNTAVTNAVWSQIAVSQDDTNRFLYINGVEDTDGGQNVQTPTGSDEDLAIGIVALTPNLNSGFNGQVCEVRISDIVRSANWFLTDYNNQNAPASFTSFDAEEIDGFEITKIDTSTVGLVETSDKLFGFVRTFDGGTVGLVENSAKVSGFVENLTETVGITENSNRLGGLIRNFTETIGITDSSNRLRGLVKNITNVLVTIEEVANKIIIPLVYIASMRTETQKGEVSLGRFQDGGMRTEAIKSGDSFLEIENNIVGLVESQNRLGNMVRSFTDTVGIIESLNRLRSMVRVITDTVGITESFNRLRGMVRNFTETIGIVESFNRLRNQVRNISDIVGLIETTNTLGGLIKNFTETVGIVEVFNTARGLIRNFVETIGVTENFNRLRNMVRVFTDTVGIVESFNRARNIIKNLVDPLVTIEEVINRIQVAVAYIASMRTETRKGEVSLLRFQDGGMRTEQMKFAPGFIEIINNVVGLIEVVSVAYRRTINEIVDIVEASNRLSNKVRNFVETVGITESFNRLRNQVRVLTETVGIIESFNRLRGLVRNFSETVGIVEAFNRLRNQVRTINETLGIVETSNRLGGLIRNFVDTVGLVEVFNRLRNQVRTINETVGIVEAFNRLRGLVRVFTDTVGIVEVFNRLRNQVRNFTDTVGIVEASNRLRNQVRTFVDIVGITEASNNAIVLIRNFTETVGIVDVFNRLRNQVRTIIDTVAIVEASQRVKGLLQIINDTLQITEVFNRFIAIVKNINETVEITEDAFRPTYHLAGVTRAKDQSILPNCRCTLMKHDGGAESVRLYTIVANVNSDGNGDFDFTGLIDDQDRYLVKAYDDQIEDARGVSNEDLEPVLE